VLLVGKNATAAAPEASADADLAAHGSRHSVLFLDEGELIYELLELDTFLKEVIVVTDDAGANERALASDGIRRVQLEHVGVDASLQRLNTFIDR